MSASAAVRVLTIATGLAALWGFIYPRPYGWLIAVLAALPVVALAVTWIFRGSIQVDGEDTDARPNIAVVLLAPAVILALRAFSTSHAIGTQAQIAVRRGALGVSWNFVH